VNPRGRLDVLAYRLAERGAQRIMPREWPLVEPHVERWAAKRLGPKALGDLSWQSILFATNPGTLPWTPWGDQIYQSAINPFLQVIGVEDTPSLPKSSSPVSQAPAAPQTTAKLLSWSTDDLAEAETQKGKQYSLDMAWIQANNSSGKKATNAQIAPLDSDDNTKFLVLALAAAAVGVILLVRR